MPVLTVTVNIDEFPWEDIAALREQGKLITAMHVEAGTIKVGGLPHGMESGLTSVAIAIPLPRRISNPDRNVPGALLGSGANSKGGLSQWLILSQGSWK